MANFYSILITLGLVATSYATTAGTRFQLVFMENLVDFPGDVSVEIHVSNSGGVGATVEVSAPMTSCRSRTAVVPATSSMKIDMCWWLRLVPGDYWPTYKTILVESDRNVMVYGYNRERFSGDGFFVLPTSELGSSYVLASFGDANIATQFAISSTRLDTNVQIILPVAEKVPVRISYRGMVYTNGESFTLTLTQFETYLGQSKGDLTGTRVLANHPIAVFSGNVRNKFAKSSRDHMAAQLLASGDWGTQFAIAPVPRLTNIGDLVRVIAKRSNTAFRVICESSDSTESLATAGAYHQFELFSPCIIIALNPSRQLQVVQMVKSQTAPRIEDVADPVMFLAVSRNQWLSSYIAPFLMAFDATPYDKNWVFVAIEAGQEAGLNLAGASVNPQWTRVNGVAMAWVPVNPGTNRFSHASNQPFYAQIYGASDRESYGFALGADLSNSNCQQTLMMRGDMLDNDCDGVSDEETCNLVDDDGDGLVDEDCRPTAVEAVGNEYVIMFMENNVSDNQDAKSFLEIYISAVDISIAVNYTMTTENGTQRGVVDPGEVKIIDQLPVELRQNGSGISTKAIRIQASENIVVYGVNKQTFSTDAFLAFPIDVVGTEYYSAHYFPGSDLHEFAFTPTANDGEPTNVRVTMPSIRDSSGNMLSSSAKFGSLTIAAGESIDVVLDYGKTAQFQSLTPNDNLNGAHIVSNKPISVFSGNVRARVDPPSANSGSRDHLVQQLSPVSTWGQEYVTVPVPRAQNRGDVFFITASVANTVLQVNIKSEAGVVSQQSKTLLKPGDYVSLDIGSDQYGHFAANHPVQVYQYVKTTADKNTDLADPAMLLVPPVQQWSRDYKFITPRTGQNDSSGQFKPFENFVMVAINKTHKDGLQLDGAPLLSNITWVDLQNTAYTAAVVPVQAVQNSRHTISHTDPNVFFQALIYGRANRESFGLPIGMKLKVQECVLTASDQVGDGVDNDCDGSIDEELCNSIDDDADGEVDEDCGSGTSSGTSFFLTFMENTVDYPLFIDLELYVAVVGKQKATVNVRAPLVTFPDYDIKTQVQPGAVQAYAFTHRMRNEGQGLFNNTIFVRSSSEVVVFGVNKEKFSNDAFLVYPESSLGTDHYTCSWSPSTLPTQFAVVSTEDDTQVRITLPSGRGDLAVEANGQQYNSGDSFSVTLRRFQVYQAQSGGDLTGTRVETGHRAAVFSGNIRTNVELSGSRDHLVQQMLPTASYGQTFFVVPFPNRTVGDVLRIVASSANTVVEVDGTVIGSIGSSGGFLQHPLPSERSVVVSTSKPVMVVQFVKSQDGKNNPEVGDPAMFAVPSSDNFIATATFITPIYTGGRVPGMDYTNYLTLVMQAGQQGGLTLDRNVLPGDTVWTRIATSDYVTTTVTVNSGMAHSVASDSSFYGRLYGTADRESYAFPIGFRF